MVSINIHEPLTDEERREFLKALGAAGAVATGGAALEEVTLSDLREVVTMESTDEFARRGEAIRSDLSGTLNAELLSTEMEGIVDAIEQLPEVSAGGIPGRDEALYAELTDAAWRIDGHLAEVGFYASAEANLPRFSSDYVETAARQLVHTEPLVDALAEVGFDEHERTELVASVVADADWLALWEPTWFLDEADVEDVNPTYVPPLQRRAAGGALLWIDGLDQFLWQNKVLITDAMLDAGVRDVHAMLGGVYLLSTAAERLGRGEISDEELTALVFGSTAIAIASQTQLQYDLVRITDEMRAPPRRRSTDG